MIESPSTVVAAALLLGLRHAFDPDHVATLLALAGERAGRPGLRAGRLGLAWGLGHGVTLLALGLPVVWLGPILPPLATRLADAAVGLILVLLALRMLIVWRRKYGGNAGGVVTTSPTAGHSDLDRPRPLRGAFGIGLVHGVGGSAAAGMLLAASSSDRGLGITAIVIFAAVTTASMYVLSAAIGRTLSIGTMAFHARRVLPVVALVTLAVGLLYVARTWSG